jgi:hypothetical protein
MQLGRRAEERPLATHAHEGTRINPLFPIGVYSCAFVASTFSAARVVPGAAQV